MRNRHKPRHATRDTTAMRFWPLCVCVCRVCGLLAACVCRMRVQFIAEHIALQSARFWCSCRNAVVVVGRKHRIHSHIYAHTYALNTVTCTWCTGCKNRYFNEMRMRTTARRTHDNNQAGTTTNYTAQTRVFVPRIYPHIRYTPSLPTTDTRARDAKCL